MIACIFVHAYKRGATWDSVIQCGGWNNVTMGQSKDNMGDSVIQCGGGAM